jgi:hypothetical protein
MSAREGGVGWRVSICVALRSSMLTRVSRRRGFPNWNDVHIWTRSELEIDPFFF